MFLPDVVSSAEVPVEMNSFKSQQHRWAKCPIQSSAPPRYGIERDGDEWAGKKYHQAIGMQSIIEMALGIHPAGAVFYVSPTGSTHPSRS